MNPVLRIRLPRSTLVIVLAAGALPVAGCGGDPPPSPSPGMVDTPVAGVWRGEFPCDNCPGIEATLWLRPDGTFFTRRRYLAEAGEEPVTVYNLGRWRTTPDETAVVLEGRGPVRTYLKSGPDRLDLETGSPLEHRLRRDPGAGAFTDTMQMTGTARTDGDGVRFRECRSGLQAALATSGDYDRFVHRYRSAAATGEEALVELHGRFSWAADGTPATLKIERFVASSEAGRCPGGSPSAPPE